MRFEPDASLVSSNKTSDSIVILGAHQDSTNMLPFLGAPGADDDGSGTTTLVEVSVWAERAGAVEGHSAGQVADVFSRCIQAFAVLVNHTFVPSTHPVEFQFASAEEGGLLGSQAMAQQYAKDGKKVRSM